MNTRVIVMLLLAVCPLAAALALTVPADFEHYGSTFDWEGLSGFIRMPSIVALQIWLLVAPTVLLPLGLREARRRNSVVAERALSLATRCAIFGFACYLLAVAGIAYASRTGMFGMAPAGFLAVFVLLPGLLLIGAAVVSTAVAFGVLAVRG